MAAKTFNIAKGAVNYYAGLPAANDALLLVLLKSSGLEADSALLDHTTLAALLAATNDEADFTNYSRKTLASVTVTVDTANDRRDADAADITFTSAGGATNNTIGRAIIVYDPDTTSSTDSTRIPLVALDASFTTDGTDQSLVLSSGYFFRAIDQS